MLNNISIKFQSLTSRNKLGETIHLLLDEMTIDKHGIRIKAIVNLLIDILDENIIEKVFIDQVHFLGLILASFLGTHLKL